MPLALLCTLLLLLLAPPTTALFREQAEQTDWLLALVGPVTVAACTPAITPLPPATPRPPPVGWSPSSFGAVTSFEGRVAALFVGSAATKAVAGLDVGSGDIVWRQVRWAERRRDGEGERSIRAARARARSSTPPSSHSLSPLSPFP